ncbi:hypothetical protein QYM36_019259 [Artemia franciscana]|uniref:Uncharacterized protein n=1 Tax=Artemia franciscana TaxID=6661 RepID=A0AA88H862_ARTSF|nr:hypothetical protein QYM36_019259 [Artemia franciscana]
MTKSVELGNYEDTSFSSLKVRHEFVRKVTGIFFSQLILILGIISLFIYSPTLQQLKEAHLYITYLGGLVMDASQFITQDWEEKKGVREKFTMYDLKTCYVVFCLSTTIITGLALGSRNARYSDDPAFVIVTTLAVICLGIILFALQTKYECTFGVGNLLSILIFCTIFGLAPYFMRGRIFSLKKILLSAFFTLWVSVALLKELEEFTSNVNIISTKRKKDALFPRGSMQSSPEEYMLAGIDICLSIIPDVPGCMIWVAVFELIFK